MRPKKLEVKNIKGAGLQIHADIPNPQECVEFRMNKGNQPIVIGYEPFIQFSPKEWEEMLKTTFNEMVDLWNEKYANKESN